MQRTNGGTGPTDAERTTVAAFDFDGTLTRGGSVLSFLVAVRGLLPVLRVVFGAAPHLVRAGLLSGSAADDTKEVLFSRLLAGVPAERVARVSAGFAERHLRRRLRPEVHRRLERHRSLGHRLLIVSASPECYVAEAGRLLDVDGVLATRLAVDGSGLLTGRYEGANCRGAEKYARLVAWLRANGLAGNGVAQPVIWAYGNSRGDIRLLDGSDRGVNAGRLGRIGRLRRFSRLADLPPGIVEPAGTSPVG